MSDNGPLIRLATEADLPAVREIARLAWTPIYAEFRRRVGDDLFNRLYSNWEQSKQDAVERAFREHPGCMLVTEIEGRVVGFVTFFAVNPEAKLGEIGNNAIHPDFRGRGLGRRQYERVFEELRRQGMEYARVGTGLDDAHAPARKAYEAVGFDREVPSVIYYRKL